MTERLYDADSRLWSFSARVLACREAGGKFEVELDRTAFFPEGGGQCGDRGTLGGVRVLDTVERGDAVIHICEGPLPVGSETRGEVDAALRFRNMQMHSGEHIVSGIVHRLFGYDNVGFHLAEQATLDFSGELSAADIDRVELLANEAVWTNIPVVARYPSPEELAGLEYRSKLDLTENVRIVSIEGVDVCACCAPHVSRTGEIGLIKIIDAMRHRGGMRLTMIAGKTAYLDYKLKTDQAAELSAMLSAPRDALPGAVRRVTEALDEARRQLADAAFAAARARAEALPPTEGAVCLFERDADPAVLRELVNLAVPKCAAAGVFTPCEGGFRYIIGSERVDLRAASGIINAALGGRGGGRPTMIQGSCTASETDIRAFFESFPLG